MVAAAVGESWIVGAGRKSAAQKITATAETNGAHALPDF